MNLHATASSNLDLMERASVSDLYNPCHLWLEEWRMTMSEVVVTSLENLRNEVRYGAGHSFITDEPVAAGGEDAGPDPYTLLLAALGSCLSMTVTLYARRKQWPLENVTARLRPSRIHIKDCAE